MKKPALPKSPGRTRLTNQHSRVRTRPGSRCTCGAELPAGQTSWFCSEKCREEAQWPFCEVVSNLLLNRALQSSAYNNFIIPISFNNRTKTITDVT